MPRIAAPPSARRTPTRSGSVPQLPQLVPWHPVLRRGPGELQIGIGAEGGLVLSGVPDGLEHLLRSVDGNHTRAELQLQAIRSQIEPELIDRILRVLNAAGLVGEAGSAPATGTTLRGRTVRLLGAGALGRAVAGAVLLAGAARLYLIDNDPVDPLIHPRPGVAVTQAQALASGLSGPVEVLDHWSKPEHSTPDLTVIATDFAEPDPAVGEELVHLGHRHLYLRPLRGGSVVGPLVDPGLTPCLRCLDLTRRDTDPAWPTLLPQLCRTRLPVDPVLAGWAASTAVTQLAAVAAGRSPGALFGTLEMTAEECEAQFRRWPQHPDCTCGPR